MNNRRKVLGLMLVMMSLSQAAYSQTIGANSLGLIAPSGDLGNAYVVGGLFNGNLEFSLPSNSSLVANVEVGVQSWSLQDPPGTTTDETVSTYSLGAGGKYFINKLFMGADAVYFLGEFNEFTVIPNLGLRLGKFNLELSYSTIDPVNFLSFEIGYFWAKND